MTEENKSAPEPDAKAAQAKVPEFNVEELHKEIDAANKKIVSEDVAKLIEAEKAKARADAEKEFLVNQKIKDKDLEIENFKKVQREKELENAKQLEALKKKVDELASSKQPIQVHNPFNSPPQSKDDKPSFLNMSEEEIEVMEKASFQALLERKAA